MKNKQADLIKKLTDDQLYSQLLLTQAILAVVSLLVGFLLFDDWTQFYSILDFTDRNILIIGVPAGLLIVGIDLLLMRIFPESYFDDGGINERIFANMSISRLVFITSLIAISEELLFRGILQTHFGLILASLIFALVHYRYLFNWFLFLNIISLSFFIGILYELTENLLVTILAHFVIDFVLGLLIAKKRLNP